MTAYLDNAATTVVSDEVLKKIKTEFLNKILILRKPKTAYICKRSK